LFVTVVSVLGIEPRASGMPCKPSITKLYPQPENFKCKTLSHLWNRLPLFIVWANQCFCHNNSSTHFYDSSFMIFCTCLPQKWNQKRN
jgi:hypothetical protein